MRKLAMLICPRISCVALTLLLGCSDHDTYETYYLDGGSTGALAGSAASGANAGAGSTSRAGASSSGGNGGMAEAIAGAASGVGTSGGGNRGSGGTGDAVGGTAGEVGANRGGSGGSAGNGASGAGASGQAGSPTGGEAGSAGAAGCLRSSDCPSGMSCSATEQCVALPCTDVDCGGACAPCSEGKKCRADTDCASYACDAALHTCSADQCHDHRQDGLETDTDCGGGLCPTCALGKGCMLSADCASEGCDGVSLICVADLCADHRKDGDESDADCGGSTCDACTSGKMCRSSFDCTAGHYCDVAKVCQ